MVTASTKNHGYCQEKFGGGADNRNRDCTLPTCCDTTSPHPHITGASPRTCAALSRLPSERIAVYSCKANGAASEIAFGVPRYECGMGAYMRQKWRPATVLPRATIALQATAFNGSLAGRNGVAGP